MRFLALLLLILAGCGKAPQPIQQQAVAQPSAPVEVKVTVCSITLTIKNGEVFPTYGDAAIPDGIYTVMWTGCKYQIDKGTAKEVH